VPAQPGLTAETRQIGQLYHVAVLDPGPTATPKTRRAIAGLLDMHQDRPSGLIINAQNHHIGQAHKQLA
jgi:hypothetical protein